MRPRIILPGNNCYSYAPIAMTTLTFKDRREA